MCSCHSIPECCVTFSGVKLSIRSFVLFQICSLPCLSKGGVRCTEASFSILEMTNHMLERKQNFWLPP